MKKILIFILVPMLLFSGRLYSQSDTVDVKMNDTAKFNFSLKKFIIPAALISYGIATKISEPLQEFDCKIANKIAEHGKYGTEADNYLQYASHVAVFGMDITGLKAKHKFLDRTFIVAASGIITGFVVQTLKRTALIERPDGSDFYSFPSGHTATAFAGAHILFKEYRNASPWIGIAGYGMAFATGSMRMLNRKHWFGDVITGAGIGILSVEISYLLLPKWNKLLGLERKNKNLVILPIINKKQVSFGLAYNF
jgi:hypothetical protein